MNHEHPNEMFDNGRHKAKIGFVLLATEQTIEDDMYQIIPREVGLHFTRAYIPDCMTVEKLGELAPGLSAAAELILPDGTLDVITYACTSGSLVIGEERVFSELTTGAPNAKPTSLISSIVRGLKQVNAKKIVVITPYLEEINLLQKDYLEKQGFEVLGIHGLQLVKDSDMIRVSPEWLMQYALEKDVAEADTLFISCGALRSIDILERLENQLGKPVITSNQAMAWDVMRLAGVDDKVPGYGVLLRDH